MLREGVFPDKRNCFRKTAFSPPIPSFLYGLQLSEDFIFVAQQGYCNDEGKTRITATRIWDCWKNPQTAHFKATQIKNKDHYHLNHHSSHHSTTCCQINGVLLFQCWYHTVLIIRTSIWFLSHMNKFLLISSYTS